MRLPPRLPVTAGPARDEILASYTGRLAVLNSLDADALWKRVTVSPNGSRRRLPDIAAVAALTGRDPAALAAAVPELRDPEPDRESVRNDPQPGCPRCDARRPGGQVIRLIAHHEYACLKHAYWTGLPDVARPGADVSGLPEITAAQRRHLRIVGEYGWAAAYDGLMTGFLICGHLWQNRETPGMTRDWDRRRQVLIPAGQEEAEFSASRVFAVVYPEAVSLAEIIASPRWRAMAAGTTRDVLRLAAELGRRAGIPDHKPRNENDPIGHWIHDDARHPPSPPGKAFRGRRPSQLGNVHPNSRAAHDANTSRFATGERPGRIILFHRAVQPVLIREWSVDMEMIEGAIWQSQRIDTRRPKYEELTRTNDKLTVRVRFSSRSSLAIPSEHLIGTGQRSLRRKPRVSLDAIRN